MDAVQSVQMKLFSALGRLPGGPDVTQKACNSLLALPSGERRQFIVDTWGQKVADRVDGLLRQLS